MSRKEPFKCPHCRAKLPFGYVMKVKNRHEIACPTCDGKLVPEKTKSFLWGYIIGFLAVAVPVKGYLYFYDDIVTALLMGFLMGLTAILWVCFYLYYSTVFVRSTSKKYLSD